MGSNNSWLGELAAASGKQLTGHSLPEAFIFEKTKNEAKSLLRLISPAGACGILRVIVQAGRANSHIWTPRLFQAIKSLTLEKVFFLPRYSQLLLDKQSINDRRVMEPYIRPLDAGDLSTPDGP